MPRFHRPQTTQDFVVHKQVKVDPEGLPLASIPMRPMGTDDTVYDLLVRAEQELLGMGGYEVIDFVTDANYPMIVAREL